MMKTNNYYVKLNFNGLWFYLAGLPTLAEGVFSSREDGAAQVVIPLVKSAQKAQPCEDVDEAWAWLDCLGVMTASTPYTSLDYDADPLTLAEGAKLLRNVQMGGVKIVCVRDGVEEEIPKETGA